MSTLNTGFPFGTAAATLRSERDERPEVPRVPSAFGTRPETKPDFSRPNIPSSRPESPSYRSPLPESPSAFRPATTPRAFTPPASPTAFTPTAPSAFSTAAKAPAKPLFGSERPALGTERVSAFSRPESPAPSMFSSAAERSERAFGTKAESPVPSMFGNTAERPTFGSTTERPAFGSTTDRPSFGSAPRPAAPSMFGSRPEAKPSPFGAQSPAKPPSTSPFSRDSRAETEAPRSGTLFGSGNSQYKELADTSISRREVKVSDEEFILLRDFIYQQCGIFIAENRKYLVENRLSSRLKDLGLRTFGEYHNYLRFDANKASELNRLYESMTTNETSFFRNGPQLDVFRDNVLKKVLDEARAKGQRKLRIWSAGCSSGEEPYTIAIILQEVLKQELSSWDIKITANDLSPAMLQAARQGMYNEYALRTTTPDIIARYFTKEGPLYRIDPKLKNLISFDQINLNDKAQLRRVEPSQVVFCRNVIIYFDDEMKKHVINSFYDNLLTGGFLIIGHSESLHSISRTFKPEHHVGTIVYKKQA